MENSSKPEKPQSHHHHHDHQQQQPLNLKTIKDLYISANLHNPLSKPNNNSSSPPSLHWITNMYYLPGYGYLTGTILGTAKGTIQGIKATSLKDSLKVQRNLVLNCGIEGGKRCGGALGMLGLIYAVWEFGVVYFVTRNPNPYDVVNTVIAGYGTGWTYKMFSGKKVANLAGVVGAAVAVSGKAIMKKKKNAFLCHLQYES